MQRKRILILFTETFASGGIQRFNRTFLHACARLGVACEVLSLRDSAVRVSRQAALPGVVVKGFGGNRARFSVATLLAVWRGEYDYLLIGHINLLGLTAAALTMLPFARPRTLMVAHGIEVWGGINAIRRWGLRHVRQILCVSRYTRQNVRAQAPQLGADRFAIFPNALSETWVEQFSAAAAATLKPGLPRRYILSVTRFDQGDRYKGIVTVLEALGMLEDRSVHYVIVGQGDDLEFLQQVAHRCGVAGRVHFMGGLPDEDLVSLYRHCQAFVLPSGKEGFGIVFLEAMFFGAPIIAAHEKGATDVVHDEQTGLTVAYGDTVAVKDAIERLLSDQALCQRLRSEARKTVVGDGAFTFDAFVQRCAVLLGVAAQGHAAAAAPGSDTALSVGHCSRS